MVKLLNPRTLAVIKRELRAQILTRAFIISTLLVPLLLFGGIALQAYLVTYEEEKLQRIQVLVEQQALLPALEADYRDSELFDKSLYQLEFSVMAADGLNAYLAERKADLLSGQLSGIFYLPAASLRDKQVGFYSNNPKNLALISKVRRLLNDVLVARYFENKAISEADLVYARRGIELTSYKISQAADVEEDNYGAFVLAGLLAFLLYISLLMIGNQILRAVVEEKENRVVEVLLSSVNSRELMTGKIIGTTGAGLLQICIWMVPFVFVSLSSTLVLPMNLQFSISMQQILYFIANYGVGLVTFLGLFAAVGAIFDNIAEAQQGQMPIMFLILIPFYICFTLVKDPANIIAEVASLVPFASIMVMPVRMAVVDVPLWQLWTAMAINLATLVVIFHIVGKIYRIGILTTGKKPSWKQVYRWVREG